MLWVFGGLGGEVVYVDTEGSFTAERAMDMAEALAEYLGWCVKRCEDEDVR